MRKNFNVDFQKYRAAILGFVVADALGVPAEFKPRSVLKKEPITDMESYGTHNQPAGTWSDDSSMVIATIEWLREMKDEQPEYALLMDKFSNWLLYGDYTPYGETFDCGIATGKAIIKYGKGVEPTQCGGAEEWDNGNGALMRILPAALWWGQDLESDEMNGKEFIYELCALTHGHLRSKMGCLIYSKVIADLFCGKEKNKMELLEKSLSVCRKHFDSLEDKAVAFEIEKYGRLWDVSAFQKLDESEIRSSGYVVDTLEAAIWCFLTTENYKDCVLKAVNLGDDTDTVGAVAGGLAGLYYGLEEIPKEWMNVLAKNYMEEFF